MNSLFPAFSCPPPLPAATRRFLSLALLLAAVALVDAAAAAAGSRWKTTAEITTRESWDSNVYLQDVAPSPAVAGAVPARRDSLVSTLAMAAGVDWKPGDAFGLTAGYGADQVWFHSAPAENHRVHRANLTLGGRSGTTAWNLQHTATWIDGSELGPVFGGPGGAPALGGTPVRDRRAAFVGRGAWKLTHTSGPWSVGAAATAYLHDFATQQNPAPGYASYIDRSELLAGLEFGRTLLPKTRLVAGYRGGRQQQCQLHGADSPFDSTIHRFYAGIEGTPWSWLQLNLRAGPEIRHFARGTPVGFDRDERPLWADASASVVLSPRQTVAFAFRRQELPSSSSLGVYEDIACDATWRGRLGEHLTVTAGLKLARGDWQAPARRDDRIITPSLLLQATLSPRSSLELGWTGNRGLSRLPATAGREFHQQSVYLGFKSSL